MGGGIRAGAGTRSSDAGARSSSAGPAPAAGARPGPSQRPKLDYWYRFHQAVVV